VCIAARPQTSVERKICYIFCALGFLFVFSKFYEETPDVRSPPEDPRLLTAPRAPKKSVRETPCGASPPPASRVLDPPTARMGAGHWIGADVSRDLRASGRRATCERVGPSRGALVLNRVTARSRAHWRRQTTGMERLRIHNRLALVRRLTVH